MGPFYEFVAGQLGIKVDAALAQSLNEKNKTKLTQLEDKLVDAQQNLGETDISDALIAKAEYLSRIGDKVTADQVDWLL